MNQQEGGLAINYFNLAVDLTRAESAPTLAKVAQKAVALRLIKNRAQETCCCSAYSFIHRSGGGKCPGQEPINYTTDPRPAWEAEERRIFDATEAAAINAERRA